MVTKTAPTTTTGRNIEAELLFLTRALKAPMVTTVVA